MIKSFTIKLSGSPISNTLSKDSFESAKRFGLDAQYFEAINKQNVDQYFFENGLIPRDYPAMKLPGTRGCFASHHALWNICKNLNESILILEHDGVLIRDIKNITTQVTGVCHLDPYSPFDTGYESFVLKYSGDSVTSYSKKYIKKEGIKNIVTDTMGMCFFGTYGYIITPFGARSLIDYYHSNECMASDESINSRILNLQRTLSTHVRMHPFLKDRETIIKYCTRKNDV